MTDTTYDEARRCPRCNELGSDEGSKSGPRGSRMHTIRCRNERCRWYNTTYIVQVNRDGSIPPPETHRDKQFRALPPRSDEAVELSNQALYQQQLKPGENEVKR